MHGVHDAERSFVRLAQHKDPIAGLPQDEAGKR